MVWGEDTLDVSELETENTNENNRSETDNKTKELEEMEKNLNEKMNTKINEIKESIVGEFKELMEGLNNKIDKKERERDKPKQITERYCKNYTTNGCWWGRANCKYKHPIRCKLFLQKGTEGCASTNICNKWHPAKCPTMHKKTLCTNAYCLREHIKWENLTHIPTIDKHAHGAWSGYNWRPKNNNKGGFRKKEI